MSAALLGRPAGVDRPRRARSSSGCSPTGRHGLFDALTAPGGRARAPTHARRRSSPGRCRIVLENCGLIEPERIETTSRRGGYQALDKALTRDEPGRRASTRSSASGLRGRGGAGYPTGLKWATVAKAPGGRQVRRLQRRRGRPRRVHGPQRAGERPAPRARGHGDRRLRGRGRPGFHLRRGEYPLAIERLDDGDPPGRAGRPAGRAASSSRRSTSTIEIRLGAGAFVCGEETALIASIEGRRGTPRPRPPYPAESGLWGRPTLINNVETFANIARDHPQGRRLVRRRSAPRRARAPRSSPWPARSCNTGLVEVPMGTTLREIVYDIGGGIVDGRHVQGRADRRPVRRLHPGRAPRHAGRLRVAGRGRLDHGLRRHDRHGRRRRAWSTWPGSSWNSAWTSRAASASPAASAPCSCTACSTGSADGRGDARRPGATGAALRRGQATPACAAWASRRRTRCSAPCATSATSTRAHVDDRRSARPASAPICPEGGGPMSRQHAHDRRHRRRRRRGPDDPRGGARERDRASRRSATSTACATSAPAGSAWSRSSARRKLLPACVTQVEEGMEVVSRHRAARRVPPDDRRAAVRRAQPRLLGLRGQRPLRAAGPGLAPRHDPRRPAVPESPAATSTPATPRFGIDHNRCVLCTRCVRVCDEIEGAHTWDVMGRGTTPG